MKLIEWDRKTLPLSVQCELLGLCRSSLYYRPACVSAEEVAVKHRIDEIYTAFPFYGSRKITAVLNREGVKINRKRVQRYMGEMRIKAVCPGPNLSRRNLQHKVYPYLLRDVKVEYPDHVWGIDITYIRLFRGWMYLVAIIDWYSRFIISWELDQTLQIDFVLNAVNRALKMAKPHIFNSDQGSHFTSPKYTDILEDTGVNISMDGKGRAIDNIYTERFFRSLKYEDIYLREYMNPREARRGISRYMEFYNNQRPHQSLHYNTPAMIYERR